MQDALEGKRRKKMPKIVLSGNPKTLKHAVRFDNKEDVLLKSIYLSREGLIKCFGKDTMNRVIITVEVEE